MFCKYCHAEIAPGHNQCPVCHQAVQIQEQMCPNCSAELAPDAACCNSCGYHLLLKKVIKLHDSPDSPPPQTSMICPSCKKQIPMSSRFCEYCGHDVKNQASPSLRAPVSSDTAKPEKGGKGPLIGFNETTFNALLKVLDEKGMISIEELQGQIGQ